jgi:hypothetical protein
MARFFRRSNSNNNPNTMIGLFLIMLLAIFAGPNGIPRILNDTFPGLFDHLVSCARLRQPNDRGEHQSLIARIVSAQEIPLSVEVDPDDIPSAITPDGLFNIRIILINETIGTVPIVYNGGVIIGDNPALSGVGLVFNSTAPITQPVAQAGLVPESNIRLLGPRQRCVERWNIAVSQLGTQGITATSTVKAYYRNTSSGSASGPIFSDMGLWVGAVDSDVSALRVAAATAQ